MAQFLFILVNATLFIRPAEIVPDLYGWPIYNYLILACLAFALPNILEQFRQRAFETRPITLCVLGLLLAVVLSHVSQLEFELAAEKGFEFFKVVVYYLLLVGLINTPARLRRFLLWLTAFSVVLTLVAVLRYHGVLELSLPPPPPPKSGSKGSEQTNQAFVEERIQDQHTGDVTIINRLRGTGIFQDPNDLCLVLVVGILLSLYWLSTPRTGELRIAWLGPLILFAYALYLTQSRGGFLCLLAGLSTLFLALYGWRKSLWVGIAVLPALFLLFAGRMTTLSTEEGTGQTRIQIWSDGLLAFRGAPLFGIGMEKYGDVLSKVAHNSFIHCFTELGVFGGTLFVGVFYIALWTLLRFHQVRAYVYLPDQRELLPFLLAIIAAYAVGLLSLSRSYVVPTYLILGLATVYAKITVVYPPLPSLRVDMRLVQRLAVVGVCFLAASYVFVRVFTRWA